MPVAIICIAPCMAAIGPWVARHPRGAIYRRAWRAKYTRGRANPNSNPCPVAVASPAVSRCVITDAGGEYNRKQST